MVNKKYLYQKIVIDLEDLCIKQTASKTGSGEYVTDCPICLENKLNGYGKLYIKSNYSVGYCQRCKSSFRNKDKELNEIDLNELKTPEFSFKWKSGDYELESIDTSYYDFSKDYSENEVKYLIHRNPDLENLYKDLGFKFRKNKVVMPFYWNNSVFYYQVRSTESRDKALLPYFCPPIGNKPIWINPLNTGSDTLIITEGIFGAIGAWLTYKREFDSISLQGSYITKYQLWMLSNLSYSNFLIYCDDWEISFQIMKTLKSHNPLIYDNCTIVSSKFHDPEDDYLNKVIDH